jgi:hypothetical protein
VALKSQCILVFDKTQTEGKKMDAQTLAWIAVGGFVVFVAWRVWVAKNKDNGSGVGSGTGGKTPPTNKK